MENNIHSLENVFKLSRFIIPQYQRAYSWDVEPHLNAFLSDLRQQSKAQRVNPQKAYFLGTLLLHESGMGAVQVVDGQQRLTTSVIFIAAYLHKNKNKNEKINKILRNYFIFDEIEEVQKFQTIIEDNSFFRYYVLKIHDIDIKEESPSSTRLKNAFEFFINNVTDDEWDQLVSALTTAKVMIYTVQNSAEATLIFELQNDRGKRLTDLEALKSYLMHLVYLHAKNPDEGLQEIQTQFSNIYRHIERQLSINKKIPSEDAILSYHCAAYLDWKEEEWRRPKGLIKQTIKNLPDDSIKEWILKFVADLYQTYKTITTLFSDLGDYPPLADLVLLDRMATFWPLILKAFCYDSSESKVDFQLACRLMEVYAMRGYGLSNLRSDAGLSSMYRKARDFRGDFENLYVYIHSLSYWYEIANRCESGLDRSNLYKSNRRDALYLLWKYENYLRSQTGKKVGQLSWDQFLSPSDDASKLTIEHIAAQNNPISESIVQWEVGDPKKFHEVATHRLGNLVIDSKSANSSKGKYDFTDKLDSLSKDSTFLSQGELLQWAHQDEKGILCWTVDSIKARHAYIKDFALRTWNPDTYFKTESADYVEEEFIEEEE